MKNACEDNNWRYLETLLPDDLETTARQTGALGRPREVTSAKSLLRLILSYGVSNLSLKDVAAWARASSIAMLTAPALFYRFCHAKEWLVQILGQLLQPNITDLTPNLSLRAVDATVINGPGTKGTDWRVHVNVDPQGLLKSVEITDHHGGESYKRFSFLKGEIILGDRAYSMAPGIYSVFKAGAYVVARTSLYNIRLCDERKNVIDLRKHEKEIPDIGGIEFIAMVPIPPQKKTHSHKTWQLKDAIAWIQVRVVAGRNRNGQAIWIITTLPSDLASANEILRLYRLRWQIELMFKRFKTLLNGDALPVKKVEGSKGGVAETWILARFIVAALVQKLVPPDGPLSPYGYEIK